MGINGVSDRSENWKSPQNHRYSLENVAGLSTAAHGHVNECGGLHQGLGDEAFSGAPGTL